jgi:hypothetical protein
MTHSNMKIIHVYWIILFVLCGLLLLIQIPEFISKKVLGVYLLAGVALSFKLRIPIFRRSKLTEDTAKTFDDVSIYSNILLLIFSLYLILSGLGLGF